MNLRRHEHNNPGTSGQVRREVRSEIPGWLVDALDNAYHPAPQSAKEVYFSRFSTRLRGHLRHMEHSRAHEELPEDVAHAFNRSVPLSIADGATRYFQSFPVRVWTRIRRQRIADNPVWLVDALELAAHPAMPEDERQYFERFGEMVKARERGERPAPAWLDGALSEHRWKIPSGENMYFHMFYDRVSNRIEGLSADESEQTPQWLDDALRSGFPQQGTAPPKMREIRIPREADRPHANSGTQAKPSGKIFRMASHPATQWGIAAAFALLVGLGILLSGQDSYELPQDPASVEEVMQMQQSLSGYNSFGLVVQPTAEGIVDEGDALRHHMRGNLGTITDDELRYIINNLSVEDLQ